MKNSEYKGHHGREGIKPIKMPCVYLRDLCGYKNAGLPR